jgi:hypothetical protein
VALPAVVTTIASVVESYTSEVLGGTFTFVDDVIGNTSNLVDDVVNIVPRGPDVNSTTEGFDMNSTTGGFDMNSTTEAGLYLYCVQNVGA